MAGLISADTTFFDNPDDAFIMNDFTTSGGTGGITGGSTGDVGCRYQWNCTDWSECLQSGKQTRNCTNIGTCLDTYNVPETEQNCTYTASKADEEDKEAGEIIWEEIMDKNKIVIYFIIILAIIFIMFFLKRIFSKNNKKRKKRFSKK